MSQTITSWGIKKPLINAEPMSDNVMDDMDALMHNQTTPTAVSEMKQQVAQSDQPKQPVASAKPASEKPIQAKPVVNVDQTAVQVNKKQQGVVTQGIVTYDDPHQHYTKEGIAFGTENISLEDCNLPKLVLLQEKSKQAIGHPDLIGKFYHTVEEAVMEKVEVVMLFMHKSRRLFNKNFQGAPLCGSDDAVVPIKRFNAIFSQYCANCPKSMWVETKDDPIKPECTFMFNYALILPGEIGKVNITPTILSFYKSQIKEAQKWNSLVKSKNIPFYFLVVELTAHLEGKGSKSAYVPMIKVIRETTQEERVWCLAKAKEFICFKIADSVEIQEEE